MIKFCLFDMDGLLLDTEAIYTAVTQRIVSRYGKTFEWSLKSRMMGQRQLEAAQLLVQELQIPMTPEEYLDERNALQESLFPSARPLPGVMRLVKHLKAAGVPIAVATSSSRHSFELKIRENSELFDLFDVIVVGDDPSIKRGKPHPDIFIECARRLGATDFSQCLVFEDAISGAQAGFAAEMHVCWVPDAQLTDRSAILDETFKTRLEVLSSMTEFAPETWGLPPYLV